MGYVQKGRHKNLRLWRIRHSQNLMTPQERTMKRTISFLFFTSRCLREENSP